MTDAPHRLTIRVYYEDTDFSGVVYHAGYLRFLERGRTEMLRTVGIEQVSMRDQDGEPLAFAVRHMTIDFAKPARMDDLIEVRSAVTVCRGASLTVAQTITRGDVRLVEAEVKIALVGGGRARRLPIALVERLLPPI